MASITTTKDGRTFPTYEGELLSWSIGLYHTTAEQQQGFPRMRCVIRAMLGGERAEMVEQERKELIKASLNTMFGHNARVELRVIEEELRAHLERTRSKSSDGVNCDKCGGYLPGHSTGGFDLCECEPEDSTVHKFRQHQAALTELVRAVAEAQRARIAELEAQRDTLLEALRKAQSALLVAFNHITSDGMFDHPAQEVVSEAEMEARAAIAKATGGAK